MQQIGPKADLYKVADKGAQTQVGQDEPASGAVVLPKLLRRPARYLHRLLSGGFHLTPKNMIAFGACFLVAVVVGGIFAAGKGDDVIARVNAYNVLTVKHYDVSGNREISDVDVVKLLAPKNGETLFGYNVDAARKALKENPWVADATVAKVYPNKIAVNIEERSAFGVWQQQDEINLIDRDGLALGSYDGRAELPLFVGMGAQKEASRLIGALSRYPDIATRIQAHVRVGSRRWDLQLENGVRVMLPETGYEAELQRLARLSDEKAIFERDLVRIDLRQSDRMILKLSETASKLRSQGLDEKEQTLKTAISRRHL